MENIVPVFIAGVSAGVLAVLAFYFVLEAIDRATERSRIRRE